MRSMAILGVVMMVLAGIIGMVQDWGRPYSGPSFVVYLLLIGFALMCGGTVLARLPKSDNGRPNDKSNSHE